MFVIMPFSWVFYPSYWLGEEEETRKVKEKVKDSEKVEKKKEEKEEEVSDEVISEEDVWI